MPNIIEIIVTAKDMTGEGFGKAEAKATGLGSTLTKFAAVGGAALAVVGYESVKMASTFDSSMERLVTQAGVPQSKLASLKGGVLDLASKVGYSPDSLAESLYHVASNMESLGGKAASAQNMLSVVQVAAEGARVGNANLVDVTNALTSAVASGIPGVKNYGQAMGALNAIVGSGDMTMQNLAEAFSTGLLPVMKQYGLSLKDVGAGLATFGDLNIRGQTAATDLRMAVQSMSAPSAQGKKDFAAMGMSVNQLAEDMRTGGLMKALKDLQEHYKKIGITGSKVGQQITVDFGKKGGVGLSLLLGNMDRLESKYPAITKGSSTFGGAWKKTLEQTSTVFAQLKGWAEAMMVSIGEKLLPVVKSVGEFMLHNKGAIEVVLGVLAALVGVIGTYVGVVKTVTMVTRIWAAVQAILDGEMTLNPIGLIVVAIAALTIGIIEAYKHSKTFRDIVHDLGEVAKVAFHWVLTAAMDSFNWIKGHWPLLFGILTGGISLAIQWITTHWKDVQRAVGDVLDWIKNNWVLVTDFLVGPVNAAYDTVMGWFHDIENWISGLPGMLKNALGTMSGLGGLAHVLGFASGGITGAAGGGPRGGFTMVGEYGPELVRLPYGSQVYSSGQSAGMLGGGGGGVVQVQLDWAPGAADELVRGLRNYIRIKGGNVQQVLGQGAG